MDAAGLSDYIQNLNVGLVAESSSVSCGPILDTLDVEALPDGILIGSNLIEFDKAVPSTLRSGVALSMLAAQRATDTRKDV